MIVSHVWGAEYPWDVRVEKVSRHLVANGHQVHILARNRSGGAELEVLAEGTVHRHPWRPVWGATLNALTQFPAFFNPVWIGLMDRTVRVTRAEVLICRDLPLAPTAIHVARRHGIPMLFDMAEDYPAMIGELWRSGHPRMLDTVVRNPWLARSVERWVLPRADHILVVVEESRQRLISLGVDPSRVSVVSNTPPLMQLGYRPVLRPIERGESLDVAYLGQIDAPMRGLRVLVDAVAACHRRGCFVRATLVGRVFSMRTYTDEAGKDQDVGYGPYGMQSLFVIQRVEKVSRN